ncbi:MAG: hypothetical protein CL676_11360 [Bdellovibrionaceae bacterium]|nr:hypothetical protein [Pseudobdellovibrionaceae bacterium]
MKVFENAFKVPVLSMGFRPFFIMVIVMAVIPSAAWVLQFTGVYSFNFSPLTARQWHANEMIFGFVLAAVMGFLLTASANWTGTRGVYGGRLFFLFSLFFTTRLLFWFTPFESLWAYAYLSSIFPAVMALHFARLFVKTNNRRNLVLIVPLAVIGVGQFLLLNSSYLTGYELALYSVRFLIVVIAGRVIPFFTRRALGLDPKWNLPVLEQLTIWSALLLIFEPFLKGGGAVGERLWLGLTLLALVLNAFRLVNWRFSPAFKVKILFILYVAYLWLPIHFALALASHFHWINDVGKGSLHALSFGCMGMMILGIVHRVSLGHSGRAIRAGFVSVTAYIPLFAGALVRVFGPILDPSHFMLWVQISGALWVLSFISLGVEIIPFLISPRPDGKDF